MQIHLRLGNGENKDERSTINTRSYLENLGVKPHIREVLLKLLAVGMMVYLLSGCAFFGTKEVTHTAHTSHNIVIEDHRKIDSSINMAQPSSVQPLRLQD